MGLAGASEYIVTSTVRAAHRNAALAGFAGCATGATGATGSTGGCPTGPTHTTTPPPGGGGGPLADLAITKSVSPDSVYVGGAATFTLTVTNNGPAPATSVLVTDPIPSGLGITGSPPTGCSVAGEVLTCSHATLAKGEAWTITFDVMATAEGESTNTAHVDSAVADHNTGNDSASATLLAGSTGETSLSLSGGRHKAKVKLNGKLTSRKSPCDVASKNIKIYAAKKKGHLGDVVAKARTDADGTYRVAVEIKNKRFYQASFKGGDKCAPALSGQIKVAGTN